MSIIEKAITRHENEQKELIEIVRVELKTLTSDNTLVINLDQWPKGKPLPLGASHGNLWVDMLGEEDYNTAQQYFLAEGFEVVKAGLAPINSASGKETFYIIAVV